MLKFTVAATQHAPNYFPEYLAKRLGFFEAEGLDVVNIAPPDWTDVLSHLDAGTADLVLGGIWVPAMYHGRGREFVAVAALNSRNPKVLVTRPGERVTSWRDLEGKIVLAPGAGGTAPYVHTAGLMRKAGVDMSKVRWVRDLSGSVMTELFLNGHGDALITDAVNGKKLENAGKVTIAIRHDESGGLMPNSVYYTHKERIEKDDAIWRFCRGLNKAYVWLRENSASSAVDVVSAEFPHEQTDQLVQTIDELRSRGIWEDIRISKTGFDEWIRIQREDGLLSVPVPYDSLVDTRPAQAAVDQRGESK